MTVPAEIAWTFEDQARTEDQLCGLADDVCPQCLGSGGVVDRCPVCLGAGELPARPSPEEALWLLGALLDGLYSDDIEGSDG